MKVLNTTVVTLIIAQCMFAETHLSVDWSTNLPVSAQERAQLSKQFYQAVDAAGYSMPSNVTAKAEFLTERFGEPFQEVFFTIQTPTDKLWVRCLYPIRPWLKSYRDWDAVTSAKKHGEVLSKRLTIAREEKPTLQYPELLDKLAKHQRHEAETRARLLAATVGGVDLTNWECVAWFFVAGQWRFSFQPFYQGYRLKVDSVNVGLSDVDGLRLCEYHNTMLTPLPEYERIPEVMTQAKARDLSDKYIEKYYKRQKMTQSEMPKLFRKHNETVSQNQGSRFVRVPELIFVTNVLEIVRPNYYFTEKYDATGVWLTNLPRWSWTAEYTKTFSSNFFTFSKTPVWIYVDAKTGEMLGGSE